MKKGFIGVILFLFILTFQTPARAATMLWDISGKAQALITTGTNTVTVQLTDLYVNPTSVSDNLSAFIFTLSSAPTSASISSASSDEIRVSRGGGSTVVSDVDPGWSLSLLSATTSLDDLSGSGSAGPAHTLIGAPGASGYTNANGSIAGNGPHNPFLDQTATFVLTEAGVTSATTITSAIFQFGTTDGSDRIAGTDPPLVPEPSTIGLMICASVVFLVGRRRLIPARLSLRP